MGKPATFRVDVTTGYKNKGMTEAQKDLRDFGRGVNRIADAMGAVLVAEGKKAVEAASSLGEAVNASNVVFGDAAAQVEEFGKTAATTVGLSNREFLQLSTKSGALLQNLGYSAGEAADATETLAVRAADMASVMNTDVATALGAIEAGFRGENEQLLQYGVKLDAATVKSKAMELGLYDGTGAIDDQARALATEALILEQTDKYAGDFANTNDTLAGSQRTLEAQTEDLRAQFGEYLVPAMTTVVGLLSTFAEWASENTVLVGILVGVIAAFVVVVKTVTTALKVYEAVMLTIRVAKKAWTLIQAKLNLTMLANPIVLIIAAIVALIAIIATVIYINRDKLIPIFKKLWEMVKKVADTIKNALGGAFDWVKDKIQAVIDFVQRFIDKIKGAADFVKDKLSWLPGIDGASVSVTQAATIAAARTSATGATSRTPTINVTINAGVGDPAAIARTVRRALAADARRTGWALS